MEIRLFDYDGTLTHNGHRRHLTGLEYLNARHNDEPAIDIWKEALQSAASAYIAPVYIVTGNSSDREIEVDNTVRRVHEMLDYPEVTPDGRRVFRGYVSFRPELHEGAPDPREKVQRMLLLANMSRRSGGLLTAYARVQVWDDDASVISALHDQWTLGAFRARELILNLITYVGAERSGTQSVSLRR